MKTVFITGASAGLGLALARQLLDKGHRIIIGYRNEEKMNNAKKILTSEADEAFVETVLLDLASLQGIRNAVIQLKQRPDTLVCNAGIAYGTKARLTEDGFEETFQVNYLGHFLLTHLLLKQFSSTLKRVVVVASNAHDPEKVKHFFPAPHFKSFDEMAFEKTPYYNNEHTQGALRYVHSKLCNILFIYELHRRLSEEWQAKSIKVNAYHPGFIPGTDLIRETSSLNRFLYKYALPGMKLFINEITTADKSAENLLPLILYSPSSGKYFSGASAVSSSGLSYDQHLWKQLWEESVKWVGLKSNETVL